MADFQKPPPTQATYAYPTAYATPVEAVVYIEREPGTTDQTGVNEQRVMVGAWLVDFWGCCDVMMPNCYMVTCCSCVSLAQISERLGVAPYRRVLVIFLLLTLAEIIAGLHSSSSSSNSSTWYNSASGTEDYSDSDDQASDPVQSWIIVIVRAIFFAYIWHLRQTTRRLFRIPGSSCGDCWASFCCSCCTVAQIATHIKSYKPGDCSFGPPDVLPPYTGEPSSS